jgi:hypothetical protein
MQGLFGHSVSPVQDIVVGKYESALLCLGNLHCYFGHPKKALEVCNSFVLYYQPDTFWTYLFVLFIFSWLAFFQAFAEAVRVSQMVSY